MENGVTSNGTLYFRQTESITNSYQTESSLKNENVSVPMAEDNEDECSKCCRRCNKSIKLNSKINQNVNLVVIDDEEESSLTLGSKVNQSDNAAAIDVDEEQPQTRSPNKNSTVIDTDTAGPPVAEDLTRAVRIEFRKFCVCGIVLFSESVL